MNNLMIIVNCLLLNFLRSISAQIYELDPTLNWGP